MGRHPGTVTVTVTVTVKRPSRLGDFRSCASARCLQPGHEAGSLSFSGDVKRCFVSPANPIDVRPFGQEQFGDVLMPTSARRPEGGGDPLPLRARLGSDFGSDTVDQARAAAW